MKKGLFQKLLPHIIALAIFLIVAFIFCQPAFQGKVLEQYDMVQSNGLKQNALEYMAKFGHPPLWNTNMFSGMPNYQIAVAGPGIVPNFSSVLSFGLPQPANFFFLACICFYILCLAFRVNPYIGIFGALAYAYSTYDPVILNAGHITKMMAICFAPGLIAGLALLYEKKYWLGLGVTTVFTSAEITANHPQINYYILIAAGFMTLSYLIYWIRNKEIKHAGKAIALAILGTLIGIGTSAVTLFTTYEYAKYSMRGGKTIENNGNGLVAKKTTGLDRDYAFLWSIAKTETLCLLMPNAFGGSDRETYDENSKLVKELTDKNVPETSALQLASSMPKYWGGLESTNGPIYIGALSCILFAIAVVAGKSKHRFWILGALIFTIFMAWGKYFPSFNDVLFSFLPFYNKFRAPSMAMVVPQLLIPLMAVLFLQNIFFTDKNFLTSERFKLALYAMGGLVAIAGVLYIGSDYSSAVDNKILQAYSGQQGGAEIGHVILKGLKEDRKDMFGSDILRLIGFCIFTTGLLYLWYKKIVSPLILIAGFILVNTVDLLLLGKKYLGEENYIDADAYTGSNFKTTPADEAILRDKDPHFRVLNLTVDPFSDSKTSYYHRSIGGYHPAKLRIYQDLIENQFSRQKLNMGVLNMLDTKYIIAEGPQVPQGQQGQGGNSVLQKNDSALGAAWFVKNIQPVHGPIEEMKALDSFNAAQTVYIDKSTQDVTLLQITPDPSATIQLQHYNNDTIVYKTKAATPQFAVFSEIYYPAGWSAYLDGQKTNYLKVDYLLRGMPVPPGDHTIEFRFAPAIYYTSYSIAFWSTVAMYILVIAGIFMGIRKEKIFEKDLKSVQN